MAELSPIKRAVSPSAVTLSLGVALSRVEHPVTSESANRQLAAPTAARGRNGDVMF